MRTESPVAGHLPPAWVRTTATAETHLMRLFEKPPLVMRTAAFDIVCAALSTVPRSASALRALAGIRLRRPDLGSLASTRSVFLRLASRRELRGIQATLIHCLVHSRPMRAGYASIAHARRQMPEVAIVSILKVHRGITADQPATWRDRN